MVHNFAPSQHLLLIVVVSFQFAPLPVVSCADRAVAVLLPTLLCRAALDAVIGNSYPAWQPDA
jgi:hypothetical protein